MKIIKHLWLLTTLTLICCAILLISDWKSGRGRSSLTRQQLSALRQNKKHATVALCYFGESEANSVFLDGVEEGFRQAGYTQGKNLTLIKGHGSSEMSMLPQVTQNLVARHPDALIAASTPNLTAAIQVADASLPIIFGFSAAPLEAGAGESFTSHRPNVTGAVFTIPTQDLTDQIGRTFPLARSIGILFNPSEPNAVKEVNILRERFEQQNIRLIIGNVNTPAEVPQALQSVLQQQPDLLYLITENTVYNCMESIVRKATDAQIPVVVDDDSMMGHGALFSQGPSPYSEGIRTAKITARILQGEDPAEIPFAPSTEHPLTFDLSAAEALSLPLTSETIAQIKKVYHFREQYGRPAKIMLAKYNDAQFAEEAANGLRDGLKRAGLQEGKDFTFRTLNAQGDMSTLTAIMGSINAESPDLLLTISTPCLQAALRLVEPQIPIVFTAVADGVKAGAGRSETDHKENVTGITTRSPFDEMAAQIKKSIPNVQRAGTLFTPAEVNSVLYSDLLEKALARHDIELIRVPVTSTADTAQSTEILCSRNIQVIAQISDNTTAPGIGQITHKAAQRNIPTFVFVSSQMESGATACIARDFYDAGIEATEKALRVLLGESPQNIPFSNTRSKKVIVDQTRAAQFGIAW